MAPKKQINKQQPPMARLKKYTAPIDSASSSDEEERLPPAPKRATMPTMKAPMQAKKPVDQLTFEQIIAAPNKTTTRPAKKNVVNRSGLGTDTALVQQPARKKLTMTRKSAKRKAAAPSSSSVSVARVTAPNGPPRLRPRNNKQLAANHSQQKRQTAPTINNCTGQHEHPSQLLLLNTDPVTYSKLYDDTTAEYDQLEPTDVTHFCPICQTTFKYVLARYNSIDFVTPWAPRLATNSVNPNGWILLDLEQLKEQATYSLDDAWRSWLEENGQNNNNDDNNDDARDRGGDERREENEEEQNDSNGKRGENYREDEGREEEEEEQNENNEKRGEKKRREGRAKEGGEQDRREDEEDEGRGEERREGGDEEEMEEGREVREELKRGKKQGGKGETVGGKETSGERRSENGGKTKERSEGGGKGAGEKKQPPAGAKMTHSQWRRTMRINKKKGIFKVL